MQFSSEAELIIFIGKNVDVNIRICRIPLSVLYSLLNSNVQHFKVKHVTMYNNNNVLNIPNED